MFIKHNIRSTWFFVSAIVISVLVCVQSQRLALWDPNEGIANVDGVDNFLKIKKSPHRHRHYHRLIGQQSLHSQTMSDEPYNGFSPSIVNDDNDQDNHNNQNGLHKKKFSNGNHYGQNKNPNKKNIHRRGQRQKNNKNGN